MAGIPRQSAEFVLTGQHAEVLRTVSTNSWGSDAATKNHATLYAGFGDVDAAVLRRWGRWLDAALGTNRWRWTLGDLAGCHWPELMLKQAAASARSGPLPFTFADLERIAAEDGTPAADLVRMTFTVAPYARYHDLSDSARGHLPRLPGFADAVVAHRDVVASVLASECWQDMRLLAAEGTGFDPEWETKTGF